MHRLSLKRRADNSVESRVTRTKRILHDRIGQRAPNTELAVHSLLIYRGQHSYRNKQRTAAVLTGQSLDRCTHHLAAACGVKIADINIESGKHRH